MTMMFDEIVQDIIQIVMDSTYAPRQRQSNSDVTEKGAIPNSAGWWEIDS